MSSKTRKPVAGENAATESRIQEARDRLMDAMYADKPSIEKLIERGELSGESLPGALFHQLRVLRWELKAAREGRGLSLAKAGEAAGIDGPALSRIERGEVMQPTLLTLWKLADSLGFELTFGVQPKKASAKPVEHPKSKAKSRVEKSTVKK